MCVAEVGKQAVKYSETDGCEEDRCKLVTVDKRALVDGRTK